MNTLVDACVAIASASNSPVERYLLLAMADRIVAREARRAENRARAARRQETVTHWVSMAAPLFVSAMMKRYADPKPAAQAAVN